MDRSVRDQIVNMISTLEEAILYFKNMGINFRLLHDCNEVVDSISKISKESLSAGRYKAYNEKFLKILIGFDSLKNQTEQNENTRIYCEDIISLLKSLQQQFYQEQEVKKEILFLPYKASMWDCMESIWLAAKDDPFCDVYVMLIPYCDRQPDGSAGQWHCEIDLMPKEVPLTDYRQYDITERKPDVIYIHNPYDGGNRVTSVHPNYYTNELKKYTNMLVYIPYFVSGEIIAETFYDLPAYQNIDKIIIQHKNLKKCYASKFRNKLVPLGSPKFDRIVRYMKQHPPIPKEWKERIDNRKVVFFNTSLSGLLTTGINFLKKMEQIFDYFESRSDIVLLWRPHPLMKATLKSMRLQWYEKYISLEQNFIENDIGIFDNTGDASSSIAIADAYIGETSSSIVYLFGITGKPIFALDMNWNLEREQIIDKDSWNSLSFATYVKDGENIWFVPRELNSILKMNLEDGIISEVTPIPDQVETWSWGLYRSLIKNESKLILIPCQSKHVWEYDLKSQEFKSIFNKKIEAGALRDGLIYKNMVFIIPYKYHAIICYDLNTGRYEEFTMCIKDFSAGDDEREFGQFVRKDNRVFLTSLKSNRILEFNMETKSHKIHKVGKKNNTYCGIYVDGDNFLILQLVKNSIVKWNISTGKVIEYSDFPEDVYQGERGLGCIVGYNDEYLIFPCWGKHILKFNSDTGKIQKIDFFLPYDEGQRKNSFFTDSFNYWFAKQINSTHIIALSSFDYRLLKINVESGDCISIPCRLNMHKGKVRGQLKRKYFFNSYEKYIPYACLEGSCSSLHNFINELIEENIMDYDQKEQIQIYAQYADNVDGTCGERIHKYIMAAIIL